MAVVIPAAAYLPIPSKDHLIGLLPPCFIPEKKQAAGEQEQLVQTQGK